jgi:hypothetical protein
VQQQGSQALKRSEQQQPEQQQQHRTSSYGDDARSRATLNFRDWAESEHFGARERSPDVPGRFSPLL